MSDYRIPYMKLRQPEKTSQNSLGSSRLLRTGGSVAKTPGFFAQLA
jgi:hypothetical protein